MYKTFKLRNYRFYLTLREIVYHLLTHSSHVVNTSNFLVCPMATISSRRLRQCFAMLGWQSHPMPWPCCTLSIGVVVAITLHSKQRSLGHQSFNWNQGVCTASWPAVAAWQPERESIVRQCCPRFQILQSMACTDSCPSTSDLYGCAKPCLIAM